MVNWYFFISCHINVLNVYRIIVCTWTSQRTHDVMITSLLRRVSAGLLARDRYHRNVTYTWRVHVTWTKATYPCQRIFRFSHECIWWLRNDFDGNPMQPSLSQAPSDTDWIQWCLDQIIIYTNNSGSFNRIQLFSYLLDNVYHSITRATHTLISCVGKSSMNMLLPVYDSLVLVVLNTLRPNQNCRHFADDIFKWIFRQWKCMNSN